MRPRVIVVALTGLLLQVAAASAQSTVEFTVSGSSTVRNWTCSAQGVVAVTPGTAAIPAPGFATGVQAATVTVPLKAFKCPNDEMTQHLNEAMHADKFPEIVYRLEKYAVVGTQAQADAVAHQPIELLESGLLAPGSELRCPPASLGDDSTLLPGHQRSRR